MDPSLLSRGYLSIFLLGRSSKRTSKNEHAWGEHKNGERWEWVKIQEFFSLFHRLPPAPHSFVLFAGYELQGFVYRKPRKLFGPVSLCLRHQYLKSERLFV